MNKDKSKELNTDGFLNWIEKMDNDPEFSKNWVKGLEDSKIFDLDN